MGQPSESQSPRWHSLTPNRVGLKIGSVTLLNSREINEIILIKTIRLDDNTLDVVVSLFAALYLPGVWFDDLRACARV